MGVYLYLMLRYCFFIPLLFVFTLLVAEGPKLTSDKQEFNQETNSIIAKGNARLESDNFLIISDVIEFFKVEQKVTAKGNARATRGNLRLVSPSLSYHIASKTISAEDFKIGSPPFFASGSALEVTPDEVNAENAIVHVHEPDGFEPNISAESITYNRNDNSLNLEKLIFKAGDFPLFYLNTFSYNSLQEPFYPSVSAGLKDNLGGFVKTELLVAYNEELYLGGFLDIYTKRGFLFGPKLKYESKKEGLYQGEWELGYIKDQGDIGTDSYGEKINSDRFLFKGVHKELINENIEITSQIDWREDAEIIRDFRSDYFNEQQEPDNFLEANYERENTIFSAFIRANPNDHSASPEKIPELRYDLLSMPILNTAAYHNSFLSYSYLNQKGTNTITDLESSRLDYYYSAFLPLTLDDKKWLNITPIAGIRATQYFDIDASTHSYTKLLGELGFDANLQAHSTWNYQNRVWGINGIRHIIKPVAQYRYIPSYKKDEKEDYARIDKTFNTPRKDPLELGYQNYIDSQSDAHTLRFGLENLILTRHVKYGSKELLSANVYQDLLFEQKGSQDQFNTTHIEASFAPVQWLELELYSRILTEDLTLDNAYASAKIFDGDQFEIRIASEVIQHDTDEYSLGIEYKLTERTKLKSFLAYDDRNQDFSEIILGMEQFLGSSWLFDYSIGYFDRSTRQGRWRFDIKVDLVTF